MSLFLFKEGERIEELLNEGVLEDGEYDTLMGVVNKTKHGLALVDIFAGLGGKGVDESSELEILHHLEFLRLLSDQKLKNKITKEVNKKFISKGDKIFCDGDEAHSVFVIIRGTANLVVDGKKRAVYCRGSFIGWPLVAETTFRGDLSAVTSTLEYFAIPGKVLQELFDSDMAVFFLWFAFAH